MYVFAMLVTNNVCLSVGWMGKGMMQFSKQILQLYLDAVLSSTAAIFKLNGLNSHFSCCMPASKISGPGNSYLASHLGKSKLCARASAQMY